jgi:two-component system, NarL family, response regulator YdfI
MMLEIRSNQLEHHIMIVARSSTVRAGLKALLENDFEIVGQTPGVDTLEVLNLDVIVTDDLSSLNAASELPAIVLISDHANAASDLLEFNPHGWALISPDAPETELKTAIHAAAQGFTVMTPNILEQLLNRHSEPNYDLDDGLLEHLTPRELEVLEALAQGLGNKSIAKQLEISQSTVKFHIAQIYAKLNVSSRVSAVNLGIRHGLIAI